MKKRLLLGVIATTMALSLVACGGDSKDASSGNKSELKDGTYTVETKADDKGNTAKLVLEVKSGKIEKASYNESTKDGKLKREDTDYNKMMKDKSGSSPEEFEPEFEKQIVE
ncbi:MAG: FMN-binding protein, partial [Sarcina sp.]